MGAYESIHNDTAAPVVTWWQLLGGGPPNGSYDYEILHPNTVTEPKTLSLSLVHQVCVRFRDPAYPDKSRQVCAKRWSPSVADRHQTILVSDIIGKNKLPLWKQVQEAKKKYREEEEQAIEQAENQAAEKQYEMQKEKKAEQQALQQEQEYYYKVEKQAEKQAEKEAELQRKQAQQQKQQAPHKQAPLQTQQAPSQQAPPVNKQAQQAPPQQAPPVNKQAQQAKRQEAKKEFESFENALQQDAANAQQMNTQQVPNQPGGPSQMRQSLSLYEDLSVQPTLSALQLCSGHVEHLIPGLIACLLVWLGFKKFRSLQKPSQVLSSL